MIAAVAWLQGESRQAGSGAAPVARPDARPRWEYATLAYTDSSAMWIEPTRRIFMPGPPKVASRTERIAELYAKLGGKPVENVINVDLLNLLGEQGWELVSETTVADEGESSRSYSYIFKRQKID